MKNATSFTLEESLVKRLKEIAKSQSVTTSQLVNRILTEAVNAHDDVIDGLKGVDVWGLIDELAKRGRKKRK